MHGEAFVVLRGFLDAEYGFDAAAIVPVRIGDVSTSAATRCWITAWNPLGKARDDAANTFAQAQLHADLDRAGVRFESGFAQSPIANPSRWHEPCAVTVGDAVAELDRLAQVYRQLAIVVCEPGQPARLRCYRRFWQEAFTHSDMDAANVEWVA